MLHHLVVVRPQYLRRILEGAKTVECRLSRYRQSPFGSVWAGDHLWFKLAGGPILLTASVAKATFIHPLTPKLVREIRREHGRQIQAGVEFFHAHTHARYATLVLIAGVQRIAPLEIVKRDRRSWVVLRDPPRSGFPVLAASTSAVEQSCL